MQMGVANIATNYLPNGDLNTIITFPRRLEGTTPTTTAGAYVFRVTGLQQDMTTCHASPRLSVLSVTA